MSDWVLWHDGNPNAVVDCITLARENARSVREQISGEMWEAINKLFLLVRGADRARGLARRRTRSSSNCGTTRTSSRARPTRR